MDSVGLASDVGGTDGTELRTTGNVNQDKLIWSVPHAMGISFLCVTFQGPSTSPRGSLDKVIDNCVTVR